MEENKPKREWLKQYYWKPGQSGNPAGRPKGKTLKDYVRDYLACMNDDERQSFLEGLPKEVIWRMAEGNPQSDITSKGEAINPIPIYNGLSTKELNKNNEEGTKDEPKE
jgi:hypothetical protein